MISTLHKRRLPTCTGRLGRRGSGARRAARLAAARRNRRWRGPRLAAAGSDGHVARGQVKACRAPNASCAIPVPPFSPGPGGSGAVPDPDLDLGLALVREGKGGS
jgi:hypothetical protein